MTLPTGTVTFLFTDIEGSTRRWDAHPEAMRRALARHDSLMRGAVEGRGGFVFKTVGDAFCAVFAEPFAALEAALDAQRSLIAEKWPPEIEDLKARMALHTGEAEARDRDYFGPPVNRVARLLAIGHGEQVLVSWDTRQHLNSPMPHGCDLRDMGTHRLKDLTLPEHVWQLLHPDLPADFPPLRSLQSYANNLPIQETPFIGRDADLERLTELLDGKLAAGDPIQNPARLITLTGSGGCGKTRLALQVAADRVEQYPDGVWLAELAAVTDGALTAQVVAKAVGLREEAGRPIIETLIDHLRTRKTLLVLDNCEQVVEAAAELAVAVLRECREATILATSREPLRVTGEVAWRVPSLPLPDPTLSEQRTADPDRLAKYDSVALFADRARRVNNDFRVSAENGSSVARICQRLDGIPLAIELAAACALAMTPAQIAGRLDDRFHLLTEGDRTALPRQRTLQAVIDWSYNLLTQEERRLFARLGIFAGSWSLDAAEAVCPDLRGERGKGKGESAARQLTLGGHPSPTSKIRGRDVPLLLSRLVSKSLVNAEPAQDAGAVNRYRMLETVRMYARERLEEEDEEARLAAEHANYFLALAEKAEPLLSGPDQAEWLNRLEADHDNLRAAIKRSIEYSVLSIEGEGAVSILNTQNSTLGLRLSGALWRFWHVRGHWSEGRRYLEEALAPLSHSDDGGAASWPRSGQRRGSVPGEAGGEGAVPAGRQVPKRLGGRGGTLAGGEGAVDEAPRAKALHGLGTIAYTQGDYAPAKQWLSEALKIRRKLKDAHGVAATLNNLGAVARDMGDAVLARKRFEESLKIRRRIGDRSGEADVLLWLGNLAYDRGDRADAEMRYRDSLAAYRQIGHKANAANALHLLGVISQEARDYDSARRYFAEALGLSKEVGAQKSAALALMNLGNLARMQSDFVSAQSLLQEALTAARTIGDRHGVADCLTNLSAIALLQERRDPSRARLMMEEALALYQQCGSQSGIAVTLEASAAIAALQGNAVGAAEFLGAAAAKRHELSLPIEEVDRQVLELALAASRAHLDKDGYARAFAEGLALQPIAAESRAAALLAGDG